MPCIHYSSEESCKDQTADAAYSRPVDWWKDSDYKSEEEASRSQHVQRTKSRYIHRKKRWSIVRLSYGAANIYRSEKLEEEFRKLVKQWKEETFFLSSLSKQFTHPAYVRIMAMGKDGLPFVLRELQSSQDNWFYALKFMAGKDIALGIKDFVEAKVAWLEWGHKNKYI